MRSSFSLLAVLVCSAQSTLLDKLENRALPSEAVLLVNCGSAGGGQLTLHDYAYYYGSDREARLGGYPCE
jgi:hypothetical protein